MTEQIQKEWIAVADRFWSALDRGIVEEATACCLPSVSVWHNFDRKTQNLTEAEAGWRTYINAFVERSTTEIARDFFADGITQRHILLVRRKAGGPRLGLAVSVRMQIQHGKIAAIDEYLDRNGYFDPTQ